MKLKYRLEIWETTLLFQVLEMDERFRGHNNSENTHFTRSVNVKIKSRNHPCLAMESDSNILYLQGGITESDLVISQMRFPTKEVARTNFNRIQAALADWAANWEGWKETKGETVKNLAGVYEL